MPIHPEQAPRRVALAGRPDERRDLGDLARTAASRGGQRPFVTFYDDRTGERTELGHATLDNWVAKAANLLTDEFDATRGTVLDLRAGTHWTALVALLAAWRCGSVVRWDGPGDAEVTVLGEERVAEMGDPRRTLVVGSGLAGRLTTDAAGALGFTDEVLACPDEFDDPEVPPGTAALIVPVGDGGRVRGEAAARDERTAATHRDLLALGAATVEVLDLARGDRMLLLHGLDSLEGVAVVLACLEADASLVLVASARADAVPDRARAERCDLVLRPPEHGHGGEVPEHGGEVGTVSLHVERGSDGALSAVSVTSGADG